MDSPAASPSRTVMRSFAPTAPAAHRCLLVNEIFEIVAELLLSTRSKRTLASLACTCKAMRDSADPFIWGKLDTLAPLLRLLPAGTWAEGQRPDNGKFVMIAPPVTLQWTRFQHYAQYVREFLWKDPTDVSVFALHTISLSRPALQPLFPHLQELVWVESRSNYFPFVHMFFAPRIRTLRITPSEFHAPVIMSLLEHAGNVCKNIKDFEIGLSGGNGDEDEVECKGAVGSALARFIGRMTTLERVSVSVRLSETCVAALAALPQLTNLTLVMDNETLETLAATKDANGAEPWVRGPWFDSLEDLSLQVSEIGQGTMAFLGSIRSTSLRELLLVTDTIQPDTQTVRDHLRVVARSAYRDSLSSLQLEFSARRPEDVVPVLDVGHAAQPLFGHVRNLTTFIIRSDYLVVDALALKDIASAWPVLEILALISYRGHTNEDKWVTLEGLVPLAFQCPNLALLELHVDATEIPDEATIARLLPAGPSPSRLTCFWAFDSPILQPEPVASFLQRLFPLADEVAYRGGAQYTLDCQWLFDSCWRKVQRLLRSEPEPQSPRRVAVPPL
ncbi:hypothetical protein C8Q77DRAFT_675071 [Trametes polyzona]|nr:hypothetical protein C8Q77DRAFT_675071 [Trametes polyzona]